MSRFEAAGRRSPRALRRAAPLLFLAGAVSMTQGGWIYLKAGLAQLLIERSWERGRQGGEAPPPWPWADTHPLARLAAPRLGEEIFVLAGSSGRTLAFGPGHVAGTAVPGAYGNSVVGGHRDTHFSFLEDLRLGDALVVETPLGETRTYRVRDLRTVDHRDTGPLQSTDRRQLTLITCYPFDALAPGGPLRWVVTAVEGQEASVGELGR